mgnify:CR=1 FL=1|jgi:hypothetical protein
MIGSTAASKLTRLQDMDQLPPTLQFLGPEKKREEDPVLRMMCVEILLLLSTSEFRYDRFRVSFLLAAYTGRQALRNRGAYLVVRELHKVEQDQAVCQTHRSLTLTDSQIKDAVERLVSLIQGEEGAETKNEHIEELVQGEKPLAEVEDELDVVEV